MGKLFRSLSVFSLATILSRVTGLLRELSLAYFFGASAALDLFWIAYRIPNFLRRLFAEGALSQAMIPVLSEYRVKNEEQEIVSRETNHSLPATQLASNATATQNITHESAVSRETFQTFLNQMASWMLLILAAVALLAHLFAPQLIWLFAPGIARDAARLTLGVKLLKITFPALIFISLAAYSGSILNSYQRFGVPAFAQNWFNIIIIAIVWGLAPQSAQPVRLLAWGVLISSILQWLFQLPSLKRLNASPKFTLPRRDPGVRKVVKLMLPALFGVSVAQINLLVDTFLVSFLPPGSISWLNYADRLTSLPLGVVGVALATVILPQLASKHCQRDLTSFQHTLRWAIHCMLLVALPCMLILQLLAVPIIATLFQRGAFTAFDTAMTARALRCLALGIPAFMAVKILATCFYAQQNLKTPVKIAIIAVLTNGLLAALFIRYWQHAGISLATTLSSYLNAILLWIKLRATLIAAKVTSNSDNCSHPPRKPIINNPANNSSSNLSNNSLNVPTNKLPNNSSSNISSNISSKLPDNLSGNLLFLGKLVIALSALAAIALCVKHCFGDWQTMNELARLIKLAITISAAFVGYIITLVITRVPLKQLLKT